MLYVAHMETFCRESINGGPTKSVYSNRMVMVVVPAFNSKKHWQWLVVAVSRV